MQGVLRFLQFRNNQKELASFSGNCLLWSANVLVTFLEKYCISADNKILHLLVT